MILLDKSLYDDHAESSWEVVLCRSRMNNAQEGSSHRLRLKEENQGRYYKRQEAWILRPPETPREIQVTRPDDEVLLTLVIFGNLVGNYCIHSCLS